MTSYVVFITAHPKGVDRPRNKNWRDEDFFPIYEPFMTDQEAEELLAKKTHFSHVNGRVLNVDLDGNEFDPSEYDQYNGQEAATFTIACCYGEHKGFTR